MDIKIDRKPKFNEKETLIVRGIDPQIKAKLKELSADKNRTLGEILNAILREVFQCN